MKFEDSIYLRHILDSIEDIDKSTRGFFKKDFKSNKDIVDATTRRIEIIGEAVKNISTALKEKYPQIEWKKIAGTRDVLIHAYFSVDLDLLWDIVKIDLPRLKKETANILNEEKS